MSARHPTPKQVRTRRGAPHGSPPSSGPGMAGGNDNPNLTHPGSGSGIFKAVKVLDTARERPPDLGGL